MRCKLDGGQGRSELNKTHIYRGSNYVSKLGFTSFQSET